MTALAETIFKYVYNFAKRPFQPKRLFTS